MKELKIITSAIFWPHLHQQSVAGKLDMERGCQLLSLSEQNLIYFPFHKKYIGTKYKSGTERLH